MGIHIPLSLKSQAETRTMSIACNNCKLPSNNEPNNVPSQEMIMGYYYLTSDNLSINYLTKKILCQKN